MKQRNNNFSAVLMLLAFFATACYSQQGEQSELDEKVSKFLDSHSQWYDMNVPASDGKLLYDLIIENDYKQALEIDEGRHNEALKNFREAGVEEIIDARLANAHDLVPELKGPFDFVFSDADKSWYQRYFTAVDPKLKVRGCYATHNVSDRGGVRWNRDYLEFLLGLDHYETKVDNRGGGMAISFKKSGK